MKTKKKLLQSPLFFTKQIDLQEFLISDLFFNFFPGEITKKIYLSFEKKQL